MKSEELEAGARIERLARALPGLSKAQGPFLKEFRQHNRRKQVIINGRDETPYPLDDLRMLYAEARYAFGESDYYAPLRAAMDPVRTVLRSHPTLWVRTSTTMISGFRSAVMATRRRSQT